MARRQRVAVTGGTGRIGGILRMFLGDRFDWTWLSQADADVTDLRALERAFADHDAVVHLAANPEVDAAWGDVLGPNIVGAYNAYEAAKVAGVRRFVFASSNHAMGMYLHDPDRFVDPDSPVQVTADAPVRPDGLYGATKVWGEALGRLYAERHDLEVVCLRIGWVPDEDQPPAPSAGADMPPRVARLAPAMWLSRRDCAALVEAALTADVRFALVNGVSDNRGRWFSLDEGRQLLGWEPQDGFR